MLRGIGASRNGMRFEQYRSEVIANNVANVNTEGFRRSIAVGSEFAQMMLNRLGDPARGEPESPEVGRLGHGVELAQVVQTLDTGALRQTDNPLDLALLGPGEFTYLTPEGPRYTRSGVFHQDEAGRLVTADGDPVLVGGAPVGQPGAHLAVESDGTVLVDGAPAGKLDIRGGDGTPVATRMLEASAVDLGVEMTDLITAMRSFQVNQRAMQMQDQTLAKAVTEIGKV